MHLDDPFLEAEARKREEVLRQEFFHLGFSDDCRLMWCRCDGISIWFLVYVEPSHAWTCHCWQLLITVALNHFFATPFSNHCFLLPYETHLQITTDRYLDGWEHVTENTCETSPTHLHHGFVAKWGTYVSPTTNHLETELGLPKILKV